MVSFTKLFPEGISKTPILNWSELSFNSDLQEIKVNKKEKRNKNNT
jgi:hypothetical protein